VIITYSLRWTIEPMFAALKGGEGMIDMWMQSVETAYVHETDRHFHQSGHLSFNHSRHFAKTTAGPAPWSGACRWRLT
jgi:hypothetical protein